MRIGINGFTCRVQRVYFTAKLLREYGDQSHLPVLNEIQVRLGRATRRPAHTHQLSRVRRGRHARGPRGHQPAIRSSATTADPDSGDTAPGARSSRRNDGTAAGHSTHDADARAGFRR